MRPLRVAVWAAALAVLAVAGGPARAAWHNVFQVCCMNCQSGSSTSGYVAPTPAWSSSSWSGSSWATAAPSTSHFGSTDACAPPCPSPCPPPCPQQVCTTRMVQRTYYAPVTTFEQRQQWEQVTSFRTSFFWEPVCSYRVTSHWDPCSCSCVQTSTPVTSYRLRSQCCPVQNWVSRCVTVPVTTQQAFSYLEPVTSCTQVPACPTSNPCPPAGVSASVAPSHSGVPGGAGVNVQSTPAPGVSSVPSDPGRYDPAAAPMQGVPQAGTRSYRPAAPAPPVPRPVAPPPAVRLDRIASLPRPNIEGQVVRPDRSVNAGATLVFRRLDRTGESRAVRVDASGRFQATLASGAWEVCTQEASGSLVSQARIDVTDSQPRQLRLVSR